MSLVNFNNANRSAEGVRTNFCDRMHAERENAPLAEAIRNRQSEIGAERLGFRSEWYPKETRFDTEQSLDFCTLHAGLTALADLKIP
jgi:hypothetical protein